MREITVAEMETVGGGFFFFWSLFSWCKPRACAPKACAPTPPACQPAPEPVPS